MSLPLPRPTTLGYSASACAQFLDPDERFEVYTVKMAERPHLARTLDMVELRNDDCPAACKCGGLCSKETQLDVEAQCRGLGDARNGEDHRTVLVDSMRTMQPCEEGPQPLTDGCDMAGWRQHSLVLPCNSQLMEFIHLALNTGSSSTFFRRETQWPVLRFSKASSWEILRVKLSCCPPAQRKAASIDYVAACRAVKNDQVCSSYFSINFECRNMPAKITNAAKCWMALPQYKHQVNNASRSFDDERVRCGDSMSEAGCYENIFCDSEEQEAGWTFYNLVRRFGHIMWRFSDTHGEMLSLSTYAKYINSPEGMLDDSPLAIYDSEFGDHDSPTHILLEEYEVPKCFSDDLFKLVPAETSRPPYRWILIGPPRSGTGMHIDPLWTNAWVTVLQGKKRWILFPPACPPERLGVVEGQPQIPSSIWFRDYYDKVTSEAWPKVWCPVEILQYPGETVFVPNGWMHLVINLELTVAVTHNYASEYGPFSRMYEEVRRDEPDFFVIWSASLSKRRPDLVVQEEQAGETNLS